MGGNAAFKGPNNNDQRGVAIRDEPLCDEKMVLTLTPISMPANEFEMGVVLRSVDASDADDLLAAYYKRDSNGERWLIIDQYVGGAKTNKVTRETLGSTNPDQLKITAHGNSIAIGARFGTPGEYDTIAVTVAAHNTETHVGLYGFTTNTNDEIVVDILAGALAGAAEATSRRHLWDSFTRIEDPMNSEWNQVNNDGATDIETDGTNAKLVMPNPAVTTFTDALHVDPMASDDMIVLLDDADNVDARGSRRFFAYARSNDSTDRDDCYYAFFDCGSALVRLFKIVGGTPTQLGIDGNGPSDAAHDYLIDVNGAAQAAKVDGVTKASDTDAAIGTNKSFVPL